MNARVEYLKARYDSEHNDAHERHSLGCEVLNDSFLEDGIWEKRCENWRNLCDCKTRASLVDASMKRRMLDELYPDLEVSDRAIEAEWGSSEDVAETFLDLAMLPYYHREDCRYDWVAHADRLAEKCPHETILGGVSFRDGTGPLDLCDGCRKTWPPGAGPREDYSDSP